MKEVLLDSNIILSSTDTHGAGKDGEQGCKFTCNKILELLSQEQISAILLDSGFREEFRTLKRFLENYIQGRYDDDGIGYVVITDDSKFFSLRCLYDYVLVEAELGRFERHDSCVNMDFDSYGDMCVIATKKLDKICFIEVAFNASGGEDSYVEPLDGCYNTKVGLFGIHNGETVSSIYCLEGKKNFEKGTINLGSEEMQTRLNVLVKEINLY
jgi:hypothetical protein